MAAFINALTEEGTRADLVMWVHRLRFENNMDRLCDDDFYDWTRADLISELQRLWSMQAGKRFDVV